MSRPDSSCDYVREGAPVALEDEDLVCDLASDHPEEGARAVDVIAWTITSSRIHYCPVRRGCYDIPLGLTEIVYSTHEEQALDFPYEYGYCVAVGSPNERILAFGFDRWRIRTGVPWQTAVTDLATLGEIAFVGWMTWLLFTEKLSWSSLFYVLMIAISLVQFAGLRAFRK